MNFTMIKKEGKFYLIAHDAVAVKIFKKAIESNEEWSQVAPLDDEWGNFALITAGTAILAIISTANPGIAMEAIPNACSINSLIHRLDY